MKTFREVPSEILKTWHAKDIVYPPHSNPVHFHYHEAEKWLEVRQGMMTFFSVRARAHSLNPGEILNVQPGEVHRVELSEDEVKCRMWTPVECSESDFHLALSDDEVSLLKKNLEIPEVENRWNDRNPNSTITANQDGAFLDSLMSRALIFRGANGKFLGKNAYLSRPPSSLVRAPSDTVSILQKGLDYMLLSTVVETQLPQEAGRNAYLNIRLFIKEEDSWRCRVWMNFPENIS